jgi:Do/DeqQ family serine protease
MQHTRDEVMEVSNGFKAGWSMVLVFFALVIGIIVGQKVDFRGTPTIGASARPVAAPEDLKKMSNTFAAIAESVLPSVVSVNTTKIIPGRSFRSPFFDDPLFRRFFGEGPDIFREPDREVHSLGTGFIVRTDGYIVTNNHVVAGVDDVRVTLHNNQRYPARIIGTDPATDIAVLKVDVRNLPAVTWGNSDAARVGDWVMAIGSPYDPSLSGSVTHGIISAKGRKVIGLPIEDFIQTDAPINPGNSGGPLVNLDAQVVGINTAIVSRSGGSQGIGFSIPSALAKSVVEKLIKEGRIVRGWLGIEVAAVDDLIAQQLGMTRTEGVVVTGGYRNGPAARAGLYLRDVILSFNDKPTNAPDELSSLVANAPIGSKATLKIWREGRTMDVPVIIEARPTDRSGRPVGGVSVP